MKIPYLGKNKYSKPEISYLHQHNQSFSKNHKNIYNDKYEVFYNLQRDMGILGKVFDFGCIYLLEFFINLLFSSVNFIILIFLLKSMFEGKINETLTPAIFIFLASVSLGYLFFFGIPTFYKLYKWRINSQLVQKNFKLLVDKGNVTEGLVIGKNKLTAFHWDLIYEYISTDGKKITGTYWTRRSFDHKLPVHVYILVANDELHILL